MNESGVKPVEMLTAEWKVQCDHGWVNYCRPEPMWYAASRTAYWIPQNDDPYYYKQICTKCGQTREYVV